MSSVFGNSESQMKPGLKIREFALLLIKVILKFIIYSIIYLSILDWVRDVAWAPNSAVPYNLIASCSEDRSVWIWKQKERDGEWTVSQVQVFDAPVWRVSWSTTGNILAISSGDHKVTLWKQTVDETWAQISTVDETTSSALAQN